MPLDRVGGFPTHHVTFGQGARPALMIHWLNGQRVA